MEEIREVPLFLSIIQGRNEKKTILVYGRHQESISKFLVNNSIILDKIEVLYLCDGQEEVLKTVLDTLVEAVNRVVCIVDEDIIGDVLLNQLKCMFDVVVNCQDEDIRVRITRKYKKSIWETIRVSKGGIFKVKEKVEKTPESDDETFEQKDEIVYYYDKEDDIDEDEEN